MDRAYAMTEDVVSYISDWRFPRTTDRRSDERTYSDERARLKRQQQQLEYERQEFLRAKAFEEKRMEKEKRIFFLSNKSQPKRTDTGFIRAKSPKKRCPHSCTTTEGANKIQTPTKRRKLKIVSKCFSLSRYTVRHINAQATSASAKNIPVNV